MTAKPIPDDYHTAIPYLIVKKAAEAIEFYKRAFGATHTEDLSPSEINRRAEVFFQEQGSV